MQCLIVILREKKLQKLTKLCLRIKKVKDISLQHMIKKLKQIVLEY